MDQPRVARRGRDVRRVRGGRRRRPDRAEGAAARRDAGGGRRHLARCRPARRTARCPHRPPPRRHGRTGQSRASARPAHGRSLLVFAVVPMMALWTNVHGGWLVGAGTLAVWAGLGLLTPLAIGDKLRVLCAAMAALAATLLNPYGWRLWLFLRETVGFGRAEITEWQPVYRLGYGSVLLWALVASAAVLPLARASTRRSIDRRIV